MRLEYRDNGDSYYFQYLIDDGEIEWIISTTGRW